MKNALNVNGYLSKLSSVGGEQGGVDLQIKVNFNESDFKNYIENEFKKYFQLSFSGDAWDKISFPPFEQTPINVSIFPMTVEYHDKKISEFNAYIERISISKKLKRGEYVYDIMFKMWKNSGAEDLIISESILNKKVENEDGKMEKVIFHFQLEK